MLGTAHDDLIGIAASPYVDRHRYSSHDDEACSDQECTPPARGADPQIQAKARDFPQLQRSSRRGRCSGQARRGSLGHSQILPEAGERPPTVGLDAANRDPYEIGDLLVPIAECVHEHDAQTLSLAQSSERSDEARLDVGDAGYHWRREQWRRRTTVRRECSLPANGEQIPARVVHRQDPVPMLHEMEECI